MCACVALLPGCGRSPEHPWPTHYVQFESCESNTVMPDDEHEQKGRQLGHTTMLGDPNSAIATDRRRRMPPEYEPVRTCAALVRSTCTHAAKYEHDIFTCRNCRDQLAMSLYDSAI